MFSKDYYKVAVSYYANAMTGVRTRKVIQVCARSWKHAERLALEYDYLCYSLRVDSIALDRPYS